MILSLLHETNTFVHNINNNNNNNNNNNTLLSISKSSLSIKVSACSLVEVLDLLVLFLIHHDENIRDFIGSNGVSMLEFLLRTKAILIEVDECDELITKICALAKVQGNQQQKLYRNKSNRNLHRHVLRRILFNFNIWQRSSKPVQQRIMRLLIQALDENPVTISRTVGVRSFWIVVGTRIQLAVAGVQLLRHLQHMVPIELLMLYRRGKHFVTMFFVCRELFYHIILKKTMLKLS